jgi:hypothetical protein
MPIDHIVVLMMENNGFDRMLGWMASAWMAWTCRSRCRIPTEPAADWCSKAKPAPGLSIGFENPASIGVQFPATLWVVEPAVQGVHGRAPRAPRSAAHG